jgi:hypothetical protein
MIGATCSSRARITRRPEKSCHNRHARPQNCETSRAKDTRTHVRPRQQRISPEYNTHTTQVSNTLVGCYCYNDAAALLACASVADASTHTTEGRCACHKLQPKQLAVPTAPSMPVATLGCSSTIAPLSEPLLDSGCCPALPGRPVL